MWRFVWGRDTVPERQLQARNGAKHEEDDEIQIEPRGPARTLGHTTSETRSTSQISLELENNFPA